MQSFTQRMVSAARLDAPTYEEVEHDGGATGQAAAVVVIAAIAAGIGAVTVSAWMLLWTSIAALVAWVIWAALIWVIGTKLLPERQTEADLGQLLRTTGFAAAPGVLRILDIIPLVGGIIAFLVSLWMLATMVVATRQALDYQSTWRAIGVCVIGWIVQWLVFALLIGITGLGMSGPSPAHPSSGPAPIGGGGGAV